MDLVKNGALFYIGNWVAKGFSLEMEKKIRSSGASTPNYNFFSSGTRNDLDTNLKTPLSQWPGGI